MEAGKRNVSDMIGMKTVSKKGDKNYINIPQKVFGI